MKIITYCIISGIIGIILMAVGVRNDYTTLYETGAVIFAVSVMIVWVVVIIEISYKIRPKPKPKFDDKTLLRLLNEACDIITTLEEELQTIGNYPTEDSTKRIDALFEEINFIDNIDN